jgi:hypothetical protein
LWTLSIARASFDFGPIVAADAAGLGGAFAAGLCEDAAFDAEADALGVCVAAGSSRARGLAMNPANATPTARTATSANGASVKIVSRLIDRIFIEHN